MACDEHESSIWLYCKKCDTFVCDMCHKRDKLDHYHYLFFEKPGSVADLVKKENLKSIEQNLEDKIQQAIAIHKRNTSTGQLKEEGQKPQGIQVKNKKRTPVHNKRIIKKEKQKTVQEVQATREKVIQSSKKTVEPIEQNLEDKIQHPIAVQDGKADADNMKEYLVEMVDAIELMKLKEREN